MSRSWFILCFLMASLLAISCHSVDVEVKSEHTSNKIIFFAAMIEQQRQETNLLPDSLEEIKPRVEKYLSEHRDFKNNYLSTPWTTKSIDLFSTGTEYPFWYQKRSNREGYYLYCSYGTRAERKIAEEELAKYLNGKIWHSGLYLVSNGTAYSGHGLDNVRDINADNMQSMMKLINFKGHKLTL